MSVHPGRCLCGTLRYEFDAPFTMMVNCHCSMCRKHHGAPFATFVVAPANALRWISGEERVGRYQSSARGQRAFCTVCGSVAPFQLGDSVVCPAGNLESDPGIRPQMHFFVGSKAAWYTITDAVPQFERLPPEFGTVEEIPRPAVTARPGRIAGSCLCGEVAYELANPIRMMNCHCSRCRRGRSAAHTSNLFVKIEDFQWIRGDAQVRDYRAPEARFFGIAFCARCGGGVPRISRERGIVVVPAGALDTDPGVAPWAHIFVESKASWYEITDEVPQYPQAPPPMA